MRVIKKMKENGFLDQLFFNYYMESTSQALREQKSAIENTIKDMVKRRLEAIKKK